MFSTFSEQNDDVVSSQSPVDSGQTSATQRLITFSLQPLNTLESTAWRQTDLHRQKVLGNARVDLQDTKNMSVQVI